jgi:hypothetical protein
LDEKISRVADSQQAQLITFEIFVTIRNIDESERPESASASTPEKANLEDIFRTQI